MKNHQYTLHYCTEVAKFVVSQYRAIGPTPPRALTDGAASPARHEATVTGATVWSARADVADSPGLQHHSDGLVIKVCLLYTSDAADE